MTKISIPTLAAALCGSLILTACPGDDTTSTGTETEGADTSTGPSVTTMPPPTTTPPGTGTSDETTAAVDDTSSSGPGESSSGPGESSSGPGESSSGPGESSSEGGSESSTGEPPLMMGYGDCANYPEAEACLADEICIGAGSVAVCSEQSCVDASDCTVPDTGNAVVTCANITQPAEENDCFLDCSMGETCPDGMLCFEEFGLCVWEYVEVVLPTGICPDEDLGNTVPQTVMGDNTGLGEDWEPSCGTPSEDSTYMFTAPAAGDYTFDTLGSTGDTVLSLLEDCAGPELACNDDESMDVLQSSITVPLAAGESVVIVVDGFGGAAGPFTLNISN